MTEGDKPKPLIMGKSMKPRCCTGIEMNSFSFSYTANRREWITFEVCAHT